MRFKRFKDQLIRAGILLSVPALLLSSHTPEKISAKEILQKMSSSIDAVNTLKYKLRKKERINTEYKSGEQDCKFHKNPKKIYTKILYPNKGVEVLFAEGVNNNKAFVNPNAFPYITLSLDPYSSIMRNNNHHTIHEVGFSYINSIVSQIAKESGSNFDKYFLYKGDTTINDKECYKILIDYTPFNYVNYTVKVNETVTSIAYKLFISDYMILMLNPDIKNYTDIEVGQVIKISNAYARKTFLCIDKKTYMPILQMMHDEKGLFSQYEFHQVQINLNIPKEEFTKEYKDYDF